MVRGVFALYHTFGFCFVLLHNKHLFLKKPSPFLDISIPSEIIIRYVGQNEGILRQRQNLLFTAPC